MSGEDFNPIAAEKEIEENPCNIKALSELGQFYAYKGDYSSALRYYEKIVRINEENSRAWSALGHCYLLKQDFTKCISAYHKSLQTKDDSIDLQLWYGIGMLYFMIENWPQASKIFQAIIDSNTDFNLKCDVYYKLGLVSMKQKNYESAISLLNNSLEPEIPQAKRIDILLALADCYAIQGNPDKVSELCLSALELDSSSIKANKFYSWWLLSTHRPEDSIRVLLKCMESQKNSSELYYILGRSYHLIGDEESARVNYSQALSMCPTSSIYWTSAGMLYAEARQLGDAFDCFVKSSNFSSESWEVWANIGLLYSLYKQKPEADLAFARSRSFIGEKPLPDTFTHIAFDINEPIYAQPKESRKEKASEEALKELEIEINDEIEMRIDKPKAEEKKAEEQSHQIVMPKVISAPSRVERPVKVEPRVEPRAVPVNHMGMLQSFMMNPMLFYQMMYGMNMARNAQLKGESVVKPNPQPEPEHEQDSEQVAKALIELTEDSLRKKRQNPTDSQEPQKKPKENE